MEKPITDQASQGPGKRSNALRDLRALCVSVVKSYRKASTTNSQRILRKHKERFLRPAPQGPAYAPRTAVAALFVFVCAIALTPVLFTGCSRKESSTGLRGKYYRSAKWEGEPAEVKVDPTIDYDWSDWSKSDPLPAPFSVDWTGNILIDQPGDYQFALISDDGSVLEIDGRVVVDASTVLLQKISGQINLSPGLHPIHLRYFNTVLGGSVRLFWTPPGQPEQIVPTQVLRPASG